MQLLIGRTARPQADPSGHDVNSSISPRSLSCSFVTTELEALKEEESARTLGVLDADG